MISIFHSTARAGKLVQLDNFRKGSWIQVIDPSSDEIDSLVKDYGIDANLINDALDLYEAPRLQIDKDIVYAYTRYYHVDNEVINATEPVLFIYHPDCLITVLRIDSGILQRHISWVGEIVTTQRTKLLLQFLTAVNDSYQKYLDKTTRQVLKIRSQLKTTDINSGVLLGLVETSDDLNEVLSALQPHSTLLRSLLAGRHIKMFEEDRDLIEDLSLGTGELIQLVQSRLKSIVNIRQTYDALATAELNRTFKRLTSISIFLMVPAIFAGLYGMNVLLPFQNNAYGFWIIVGIVVITTTSTIAFFNKKHWL